MISNLLMQRKNNVINLAIFIIISRCITVNTIKLPGSCKPENRILCIRQAILDVEELEKYLECSLLEFYKSFCNLSQYLIHLNGFTDKSLKKLSSGNERDEREVNFNHI